MTYPLMIAVAANGARARKQDNSAVPYTPEEIADEIVGAAEAGAVIAHVHARDQEGCASQDVDVFREIVERVRARSDIIVELSLGSSGFTATEALRPLALAPSMASFPMEVRRNTNVAGPTVETVAEQLLRMGTRPSFAVTSPETCELVASYIDRGLGGPVPCVVVAPGTGGTFADDIGGFLALITKLPKAAHWWVMKGGSPARQATLRALAIGLGGHVRVGFEDTLRTYDDTALAPSNAWFVEHVVDMANRIGRPIATPMEARTILKL